jgi:hypothetical protein
MQRRPLPLLLLLLDDPFGSSLRGSLRSAS